MDRGFNGQMAPTANVAPSPLPAAAHLCRQRPKALTGVEAINNAVSVFQPPEPRHARLQADNRHGRAHEHSFLGTIGLTEYLGVVAGPQETILSALARRLFGSGPLYLLVQRGHTAGGGGGRQYQFAGFSPCHLHFGAGWILPRQLTLLGDRVVYTNGIMLLAALAGGMLVIFRVTPPPDPAVCRGRFWRLPVAEQHGGAMAAAARGSFWTVKALLNGLGAAATGRQPWR
ncbi:MAG: hypothetical protein IPG51_13035 [Chloroflexi bacterium]|nr:hypothetical protein [Chloroflexota bacterium]